MFGLIPYCKHYEKYSYTLYFFRLIFYLLLYWLEVHWVFGWICVFVPFRYTLSNKVTGSCGNCTFNFFGNCKNFSKCLCHFVYQPRMNGGSKYLYSSENFLVDWTSLIWKYKVLNAAKYKMLLLMLDITSGKFYTRPHVADLSQNEDALKIVYKQSSLDYFIFRLNPYLPGWYLFGFWFACERISLCFSW
jgi:hypothetical protein